MRKYVSAEERTTKYQKNDHSPFLFYGESIQTSVHGSHSNGGNAKAVDSVTLSRTTRDAKHKKTSVAKRIQCSRCRQA